MHMKLINWLNKNILEFHLYNNRSIYMGVDFLRTTKVGGAGCGEPRLW